MSSTTPMSSTTLSAPLDVDRWPGRPAVVHAAGEPASWLRAHHGALRATLTELGAVLVRGLDVPDPATAAAAFAVLGSGSVSDRESFAPRTVLGDGVWSATPWADNQPMCQHHELSYRLEVPGTMMFACLAAPTRGGTTGIADAAAVLADLPDELVDRVRRQGWQLVRSYHDEIGASWADAFGTDDPAGVDGYCARNGIETTWTPDGGLRTRQRRAGIVTHPVTGRAGWFNQIAFLSEYTMDPDVREFLVEEYGPDSLPFTTRFGDGTAVGADVVAAINDVYERHTLREPWRPGDLLVVDNLATAHGREPFTGPRRIVVGMADAVRPGLGEIAGDVR